MVIIPELQLTMRHHPLRCGLLRFSTTRLALLALSSLATGVPAAHASGCYGDAGEGILVKTTSAASIVVVDENCAADPTDSIVDFFMNFSGFAPKPAVTIWSGSGDPNVHTANPLTTSAISNGAGPYSIHTRSLKDLGTYSYLVGGQYYDSVAGTVDNLQTDTDSFPIFNDAPTVNWATGGHFHVGDTVDINSGTSDPDGGAIPHFAWTIPTRPAGSTGQITHPDTYIASMPLTDKYEIGHWVFQLVVADNEGEQKTFTNAFDVLNQPPVLVIDGDTMVNALDDIDLTAGPPLDADGETVTFVWDLVSSPPGASVSAQSNYSTNAQITIPTGPHDIGAWVFKCTATDEHMATDVKTVNVTVVPLPPQINIVGPRQIKVGETIDLEDTIVDDAYGDPMTSFKWDLVQVPDSANVSLQEGYNTTSHVVIPTTDASAGTWIFKLTVTDQVNQTTEQTVSVLVDAPPTAVITGSDQAGNSTNPIDLDGSTSFDPDSPNTPPDYGHLHTDPVSISPGIVSYSWSVVDVPEDQTDTFFPGPVSDSLGVDGSGATLHIPANDLPSGQWVFQLEVTDGEGNTATDSHPVTVINTGLPPIAWLSMPAAYLVSALGQTPVDIGVDGSGSFDLDNLLMAPYEPGLGITNYAWSIIAPALCPAPPAATSGASATSLLLYPANSLIAGPCQGVYTIGLMVTDDDTPAANTNHNSTTVVITNCLSAVCLDYPTTASPQFVQLSDQTDVTILYHISSILYDNPLLIYGLHLQLEIFGETGLVPVYSQSWDVDMLPTEKGGMLAVHWPGFLDGGARPPSGKYTVTLQVTDPSNNPTGYSATQPQSIWIQTLDVSVSSGTDHYLSESGMQNHTDHLHVAYNVAGAMDSTATPYDELRYRIFRKSDHANVYEGSVSGPFTGSFDWNGDMGGGNYLPPGHYELELEIYKAGASLGKSARSDLEAYGVGLAIQSVGQYMNVGDTATASATLNGDLSLLGSAHLQTNVGLGSITATDNGTPVDIDAGVAIPIASVVNSTKTYTLTAVAYSSAPVEVDLSYTPPGAPSAKQAISTATLTIADFTFHAPGSSTATLSTDGVYVRGQRTPVAITAANFKYWRYHMQPLHVRVSPDVPNLSIEIGYDSGTVSQLELYSSSMTPTLFPLPHTWTAADFVNHKLNKVLLAYGKSYGTVILHLIYKINGIPTAQRQIKLRVHPFPGAVGIAVPGSYPFFRVLRTANQFSPVFAALDPSRYRDRVGEKAAVYLVAHKTMAQWAANPSLVDIAGAPKTITMPSGSIAGNITALSLPLSTGTYDVVYDFGRLGGTQPFATDGTLNPGDILDTQGDAPSLTVEPSMISLGALATTTTDYGMTSPATTTVPAGYDELASTFSFRLRGRLVYPSTVQTGSTLVVFAHGNHVPRSVNLGAGWVTVDPQLTSDENFRGHTYLQQHLASRGIVTMSVDLDEMVGDSSIGYPQIGSNGSGIMLRAWVTLKNIEKVLTDPTLAGGALVGKINPNKIYMIGHSRGGETVILALHLLKTPADRPYGAASTLGGGLTASGIRGIISISPTSSGITAAPILPQDVPYLLIYGSADGDVNGAQLTVEPFRHYDRATSDKYAQRVIGSNHNFYNTSWGFSDASQTISGSYTSATISTKVPPVGDHLLNPTQEQNTARGYITAFLSMMDGGDSAAQAYFLEPPSVLRPLGVDVTVPLTPQSRLVNGVTKTVLDDYETNASLTQASSGQSVSSNVSDLSETLLNDPNPGTEGDVMNRFFEETRGALFDWTGPAEYVETLDSAHGDLRGERAFSFRIAQQPKSTQTVTLNGTMTVGVELEDADGKKSEILTSAFEPIPAIYPAHLAATAETTSAAFHTFRVSPASFVADGRMLDLGHIVKIRIKLADTGASMQGRVAIDDLEVEEQ